MAKTLHFRVLAGVQAGARMGLADRRFVVGTALDCDIVLTGEGLSERHVAIQVEAQMETAAVIIEPLDGQVRRADGDLIAPGAMARAAVGECLWLGEAVAVCVAAPDSPWSTSWGQPSWGQPSWRQAGGDSSPEPPPIDAAPETLPVMLINAPPAGSVPRPPTPGDRRWFARRMVPVLGLVSVAGGLLLISTGSGSGGPVVPPAPPPDPRAVAEQVVGGAGWSERVQVRALTADMVLISGYLPSDAAREALAASLRQAGIQAVMRVWAEDAQVAAAGALAQTMAPAVRVQNDGMGVLRLLGHGPSEQTIHHLADAIREDVPGIREVNNRAVAQSDLPDLFLRMASAAGLPPSISVARRDDGIVADGQPGPDDMAAWNRLVAAFRAQHGPWLAIRTAFTPPSATLPFTVRAVMGGAVPLVHVDDGRRVAEGGMLADGYRLLSIRDDQLVVEHAGQTFSLPLKPNEAPRGRFTGHPAGPGKPSAP